jgi:dyslexia-associated protein KIAA0319-like protein
LAIGTIIGNSDHESVLMLTSVVPGRYQFTLTVWDAQGLSSSDSCSIIVHPDPLVLNLLELTLTMEAIVLTQSELESLQQKLELLLGDNVKLRMRELKIEHKTGQIIMIFYVEKLNGKTGILEPMTALDAERILKEKFWRDYSILGASISGIRTAICQNNCSGHGLCHQETRACMCETFWMPSVFYFWGVTEANCDWSILYVIIGVFVVFLLLSGICWGITCLCRRKTGTIKHTGRISSRKKPQKYALLETNDADDVNTACKFS